MPNCIHVLFAVHIHWKFWKSTFCWKITTKSTGYIWRRVQSRSSKVQINLRVPWRPSFHFEQNQSKAFTLTEGKLSNHNASLIDTQDYCRQLKTNTFGMCRPCYHFKSYRTWTLYSFKPYLFCDFCQFIWQHYKTKKGLSSWMRGNLLFDVCVSCFGPAPGTKQLKKNYLPFHYFKSYILVLFKRLLI